MRVEHLLLMLGCIYRRRAITTAGGAAPPAGGMLFRHPGMTGGMQDLIAGMSA